MKTEIAITGKREDILKQVSNEELFEIFKKKITEEHGERFTFSHEDGIFSAIEKVWN